MAAELPRRSLLRLAVTAAVAAAAGCTTAATTRGSRPRTPPLRRAITEERRLIADYRRALRAPDADTGLLQQLLDQHRAHLQALGAAPAPIPLPTRPVDLAAAERASAARLRAAAVGTGTDAALLASVAASHAAHAILLERRAPQR